jgi:hypothetical protein
MVTAKGKAALEKRFLDLDSEQELRLSGADGQIHLRCEATLPILPIYKLKANSDSSLAIVNIVKV